MGGVILILSLLTLVGCQSEKLVNDGGSQSGQQFSLTASKGAKGVGSRTAILNGKTIWSEDDAIFVSSEDNSVKGTLYIVPESLSDDKTTATFTGYVSGGDPAKLAYSVFPAPKNDTVIDLSTIEGGGEVDAPFIGRINTSDDVDVRFEHVCGVAPIVMNGYQGNDIVITATNNNSAVTFLKELDVTKVDLSKEKPEFIIGNVETQTITITSPKGGQMYVPYYLKNVPTTDNVVVFKHGDKELNKADLSNGFVGKVHSTTAVVYTFKGETSVQNTPTESTFSEDEKTAVVSQEAFSSISENATSGETQYFNVSALVTKTEGEKTETVVAEAVEVTLPKVEATDSSDNVEKSVEISFTNVTSSTTITIKESESTSDAEDDKSIDNLTVVLPSGTTAEEAEQQVVIEMPNTTVTVKSDDGNVLFIKEMTVATADNTLVVGADVEIKTLTIKRGNVQVFGKVGVIKRDDNNTDKVTVVTIEKGGKVNEVDDKDEIKVVDRNNASETPEQITVSTFAQLKSALESQPQTEVTMINVTADITLTEPLVINKPVQMNLGNKSLTIAEDFAWGNAEAAITSNANLHLSGGNINGCNATAEGKYLLRSTAVVNVYNVSLETNGVSNGFSQINKIAHFRGTSSITATSGNAIHVLINKTEKGALGVQLWGTTQINGSIAFELTCEPVENAYVAVCLLENSKLNGQLNIIKNGYESYVVYENRTTGGNENSDTEATPVADLEALQNILNDPEDKSDIILTAPIVLTNGSINLNGRRLIIDDNIFEKYPDATAVISSTASLRVENGTIYGPEAEVADSERYIIEHIGTNSEDNTSLEFNSVTFEGRAIEKAVHVKDGYLYFYGSDIEAGIAFDLVADKKTVRVNIDATSKVSKRILFTHNHDGETGAASNESGIYIEHGAVIESSLEVSGTNANNLVLDINKDESPYYGYDDISGEGWFKATVNYLQYQLNKNGIVNMSSWDLKEDIEFEVNRDEASDKTIRFYVVEELGGNGKITFKNTGNVKLELMYTLPEGRFTCENFEKTTKVEW